jgi:REP element-mobilizing transposase RayT
MPCLKTKKQSMEKFKSKYRIQSARMRNWDYAKPGGYFVTTNCANHEQYLGKIVNGEMIMNEFGKIAHTCWSEIPQHFPNAELGEFQVMPNHLHGIIIITTFCYPTCVETGQALSQKHQIRPTHFRLRNQGKNTISAMVGSFKSAVTKQIHQIDTDFSDMVIHAAIKQFGWQSRFYDHFIRSHAEFNRISNYIRNNPANWRRDRFYKP